ncbi:hypothetical protein ACRE_085210 [Hapsidospora chrysogenum ATCC 11550]|uniref:Uncharacterized protein n=1 Tax=Hapsidospora chrysogenum (strain ATCC 11550 / CBS 779.69 / DSM 880 / IAM 14645 / JCM 23072 / IMI 49137) TaxID=857340 RepID=A0A086SUK4_HAPC1|nr:hypothetical protein ACRE_085210 [Hapsidospora chrysogenum ATCC 11550]
MSGQLSCYGGHISNPVVDKEYRVSVFLYDRDDTCVLNLMPDQVVYGRSFNASYLKVRHSPDARKFCFPRNVNVNPGDAFVFSMEPGKLCATFFHGAKSEYSITFTRGRSPDALKEHAIMTAHTDSYLHKVLTLAKVHALLGSTRAEFNQALAASKVRDTVESEKLTKDQFKAANEANATVQLKGDKSVPGDQDIFDQTAMLACGVNSRLAAVAKAKHPDLYDVSTADGQLDMINDSANGLFNWYHTNMGAYLNTVSMSSETLKHRYDTATIELDAIRDLFASLALPEAALNDLLGAVSSFVKQMNTISLGIEKKTRKNAKLVNFFSVQPPLGNPDLKHLAKMRMIYCQFEEAISTWSTACASGTNYDLAITVFVLDCEMNREMVALVYDHCKDLILKSAEADLDAIGSSGLKPTTDPINVPGTNPIGPPPVPN